MIKKQKNPLQQLKRIFNSTIWIYLNLNKDIYNL